MDREEKKYEVLPGVKIPDIKSILEAASDFSNPGVDNVHIKGGDYRKTLAPEEETAVAAPSTAELSQLQDLGQEVAQHELRVQEESRKKMEEIRKQIMAPESLDELQKAAASTHMSKEKRETIAKERAEKEAKKSEEEAKIKAREERRAAQQKALEESRQKKAAELEEKRKAEEAALKEQEKSKEEEKEKDDAKADQKPKSDDSQTLDDFSEFL